MTKKQAFRCFAFLLAVFFMVVILCDLFELNNNTHLSTRYTTYTKLEKNTVDAVILGSSGVHNYFIPSKAYEDYGMTVYPLSFDACPSWLYIDVLKNALRYQKPKLVIVDIRPFCQWNKDGKRMEIRARNTLDSMPMFSVDRLNAGFKTMEMIHKADPKSSRFNLSLLLSFIKYHKKWKDDTFRINTNLKTFEDRFLGYFVSSRYTATKVEQTPLGFDENYTVKLDEISKTALYEFIDFVKQNNINVLFLDTPQMQLRFEAGRSNTVYKILEQENMPYKHYYTSKNKSGISINFNYKEDFYNESHTNFYGALKFTDAFAKYLKANYNLKDHRKDNNVTKDWDGVWEALLEEIDNINKLSLEQTN